MIPPASGLYIVPEERYGTGFRFTSAYLGYPEAPGILVGYLLEDGDKILAAFDGTVTSRGGELYFGRWQTYVEITNVEGVIMYVLGDALTFSEHASFGKGEALGSITSAETLIGGAMEMNVMVMFYRIEGDEFVQSIETLEQFFTFLFPPA